jgi:hypothetical protein
VTAWTASADIAETVRRYWNQGRFLREGSLLFPLELPLKKPNADALSEHFADVRAWIRALAEGSKERLGYGYDIVWTEINHRRLGRNRVPTRILIATNEDALRLIGKRRDAELFQRSAHTTLQKFPALADWLTHRPLTLLEHGDAWERVLRVLAWFRDTPSTQKYLRQIDVPGVDTKFIESHKALLMELLDFILPKDAIDHTVVGTKGFEARYRMRSKPTRVRFRMLGEPMGFHGFSDVTVPIHEFARASFDIDRVFITENEINGLAFPDVPRSLVVFGLGYGVEILNEAQWLKEKALFYWGDIDTHGFTMLDRLRASFPHTHSLLMDRETLLAHRAFWVHEAEPHDTPLDRLTAEECSLYNDLHENRLGTCVRLEQERIGFRYLECASASNCPGRDDRT